MGTATPHQEVALIVGMLSAFPEVFQRLEAILSERFGKIARASAVLPFDYTRYYEPEMGANLRRKFLSFERHLHPEEIAAIKLWTNALEEQFAAQGFPAPRPINLDPGYVTLSKLVLATTKDHAHRIYIGQGIFAEVTLGFTGGAFQPMPWSYPDYRTDAYREFFSAVRADLLARRRGSRAGEAG